ncbi:MAG TPA: branched-chain amino acid transport system II carrier protein [Waddliaceae bacterium]
MNKLKKINYFTVGMAIFAMFFGAGNIIFPLALGQIALDKTPWGLSGLLLTAVAMPFAGLLAMFRHGGQVRLFFNRLGKVPGLIVASLIISLLGPFGAAPRCIALAHSTLLLSLPGIPLILFSASACLLIFLFVYRENRILKLLGYFLSPLKIIFLILIIIKGFIEAPEATLISEDPSKISHFWHGLTEGYNTMDLLAAFFFAPIVVSSLGNREKGRDLNHFVLIASAIGAFLLAVVYIGFCYLAYFYAPQLEGVSNDQLLGAIALKILGPYAGLIVGLTVTFACLTTAIALIAAFTSFMHKEVLKIGHFPILLTSLVTTFGITILEFQGIARFLNPILEICYPALILLTIYNLFMPIRSDNGEPLETFSDKENPKNVIVR